MTKLITGFCGEVKIKDRSKTESLYKLFRASGTKFGRIYYDWHKGWVVILDAMSDLIDHELTFSNKQGGCTLMRMIDIYNIRLEEGKSC